VPFLARWPGRVPARAVSSDLARTLDILPTIAGIAGVPLPAGRVVDGQDIRAFLEGKAPSPDEWFFYYDAGGRLEGVRDRRWKLHQTFPEKGEPVTELFDLLADPSERWNVAADHAAIVSRLNERMRQFAGEIAGNPARQP
jgi:uncharacterized sulfatase